MPIKTGKVVRSVKCFLGLITMMWNITEWQNLLTAVWLVVSLDV